MKTCQYCGRENQDDAAACFDCGRPLKTEAAASQPEAPAAPWRKVAVLGGEVEAQRLEVALKELEVPHVLVSYRDSAMDGLYQHAKGWGHIEAAEENCEAILACLQDLRRAALEDAPDPTDEK